MVNMNHLNESNQQKDVNSGSENSFQDETKKTGAAKSGCGCGCKAAPVEDEIVEIEEDSWTY